MIWRAADAERGERLDSAVAAALDVPRNQVRRWIDDGRVTVNDRAVKASSRLAAGDTIAVEPPDAPPEAGLEPEPGELELLYEDADLVVVDKPAGLAVHPGAGRPRGTLANRLLHHYPEIAGIGGPGRPGIVHRLDVDTTGVLAVARSERAYRRLSEAFAARSVEKTYAAIVYGAPREPSGRVDLPIGRDPRDRKKMAVRPSGRPAVTLYRSTATVHGISWLELDLETGRTHQIRVHLKALGHPLVGDPTYGEARWKGIDSRFRRPLAAFSRPALHAWRLAFDHPGTGERLELEAPIPEDMARLWQRLSAVDP